MVSNTEKIYNYFGRNVPATAKQMPSKVFTFIDRQENVMAVRSIAR